ncbi:Replication factor C, subunit RFC1 (large subunit) [Ceraceosorus bombacis]|uniref:Replication factor C, subunit RFC1 (Large subunit) n=1 Tax=Ceraceosorus bombacis TaxID=401625 RepID=A0A0P1BMT5_9BASI|nr:Replication factor C, subunit RFC1 (large subunit) [Ceraceosorus bombacis]
MPENPTDKVFAVFDKGASAGIQERMSTPKTRTAPQDPALAREEANKRPRRAAAEAADAASVLQAAAQREAIKESRRKGRTPREEVSIKSGGAGRPSDAKSVEGDARSSSEAPEVTAVRLGKGKRKDKKGDSISPRKHHNGVPAGVSFKSRQPLELSLDVKGTGTKAEQAHSFFARRPAAAAAPARGAQAAVSDANEQRNLEPLRRVSSIAKRKPQLEAPFPGPGHAHVNWATQESAASSRVFDGRAPRDKGKARQVDETCTELAAICNHESRRNAGEGPSSMSIPRRGEPQEVLSSFLEEVVPLAKARCRDGSLPAALTRAINTVTDRGASHEAKRTSEMWTHRWRPCSASDCLGNEEMATYLRDWLRELEVSPWERRETQISGVELRADVRYASVPKRRAVEKRVEKSAQRRLGRSSTRRKRRGPGGYSSGDDEDDMADFIVDDEMSEGDHVEDSNFDNFRPPGDANHGAALSRATDTAPMSPASSVALLPASMKAAAGTPGSFAAVEHFRNCIVLTGPSGVGKTAAVYACASELGWEVFELFPGMKKRSGKDLEGAVGALSRNHMVGSGGGASGVSNSQSTNALSALMSRGNEASPATASFEPSAVRQSLILLEEADILYEEDKGFWPAVVQLVATSRRPIVITCNDVDYVPLSDLPVQEVLQFCSPTPSIAVPYLQTIALAEGHMLDSDELAELYDTTTTLHDPLSERRVAANGPLHPATELIHSERRCDIDSSPTVSHDLRAALNQIQFACQHAVGVPRNVDGGLGEEHAEEWTPSSEHGLWNLTSLHGCARAEGQDDKGEASCVVSETHSPVDALKKVRLLGIACNARSFADAHLQRIFRRDSDLYEHEQMCASVSDVQQPAHVSQLYKSHPYPETIAIPSIKGEDRLLAAIQDCAQKLLSSADCVALQPFDPLAFDLARLRHCKDVWTLLRLQQPPYSYRLPREQTVTEYAPTVRHIHALDDEAEASHEQAIAAAVAEAQKAPLEDQPIRSLRATRNSARSTLDGGLPNRHYERWYLAGPEELAAARRGRLLQ